MTLALATRSITLPSNTIDNIYDSVDTELSPDWRVSNLVNGTVYNLTGALSNISDCYYNRYTRQFGFIQNNTGIVRIYTEASIVAGTPSLVRTITYTGTVSSDTEGCNDPEANRSEGGYTVHISDEGSGANRIYRTEMTLAQMIATDNINIAVRSMRTMGASASDNNEGTEGNDQHPITGKLFSVQEGRVIDNPIAFEADDPADRDADYTYATDLTVTNPYNAQSLLTAGHDQSSCIIHVPTGHYIVLSDTGDMIYQMAGGSPGTVIATRSVIGMSQPEGICRFGDKLLVCGEGDQYQIMDYVV